MFRKTRRDGFHESYYDHPCLIVTERDVLNIDIKGVSLMTWCKRKWFDLFLLSHSDERAGDYYHSTHAMRMDRLRHFRKYRDVIHPLSKFRNFWDCFILHVVIMHKLLTFATTSVIFYSMPKFLYYLAVLLEICMIFDIYINTQTGFIDNVSRKVVLDKRLTVRKYCSTKLFFHTVTSIPVVFLMFLRYGGDVDCAICKANHFNCTISFMTISTMLRVFELSAYWERHRKTFNRTMFFHFLRITVILCLFVIQFLHINDTMSMISLMHSVQAITSQSNYFFDEMFIKIYFDRPNTSNYFILVSHVWRVVVFLGRSRLGVAENYSVVYPHYLWKITAYLFLNASIVWLLIECFSFLTQHTYFEDDILKTKTCIINLLKARQLSEELMKDIKKYFDITATKITLVEQRNGLYRSLPASMKKEVTWHNYGRMIKRIPCFADWPKEIIEKVVVLLKEEIFLENNVVTEAGMPGDGLIIVDRGLLAVYSSQNEEVGHLIDGDHYGELSLVTDMEVRSSSVVAITTCKVLLLDKVLFRQMMRNHPRVFYWLQEELKTEYKADVASTSAAAIDILKPRN